MKLIYEGKTKDVYDLENGRYLLKFKDDVTSTDGAFDPGANTIGMTIEGMGRAGLRLTEYFFKKMDEAGYPTHFISADVDKAEMTVLPAGKIGKGIEAICRYRAAGSFLRRYGAYAVEGQDIEAFFEITLKDDERGDPPISRDALETLGLLEGEEYGSLRYLTRKIAGLVKDELARKGLELYDIKLEFGRVVNGRHENGRTENGFVLIDEVSGGNMRAYKDGKIVDPLELTRLMLG